MALDRKKLEFGLKDLPNATSNKQAANNFAKVFADYYKDASAADTEPSFNTAILENLLFKSILSKTFLETLGDSLQSFLTTFAWKNSTFVGAPGTTKIAGPALNSSMASFIAKHSKQNDVDKLKELSGIIHKWSETGLVTLTNVNSGATFEAKIT